ncbi:carbonic anhydrase 4-like [Sinocyclocheilus grahami]|uniref:Carbonic anhydrase n=1 Tax=Sinocyclocheilus grahami TaxID=75366 RepID=A0A672PTI0_SINGR|nr:PREDICTED: carbonic anhydrase 4-like [Sinocyclocheilus grahami]XP_016145445.1 PREDICTED: carbonic anhydrase 4-like [Sinocyclocheilus grahami]
MSVQRIHACPFPLSKMNAWFMTCFAAFLLPVSYGAPISMAWCYHMPSCSDVAWPIIAEKDCNGAQQSPIAIITTNVKANANLTSFIFTGYDDDTTLTEIKNTGTTIKVTLDHNKMHVEGGDLPGLFASMQFHLHWGNGTFMAGSEHTVDGKRYPMEMHIVNEFVHNGSTILAALGFFIEATYDTGKPESWKTLTSYLSDIANAGDKAYITQYISMDDLLHGVDKTKYYRYLGSLTTPNCDEGVIWTIFKDPIKVSWDLIDLFSTSVYTSKATNSPLMVDTFRGVQPVNGRIVMSQVAGTRATGPISETASSWNVLDLSCDCQTPDPYTEFDLETAYW